MRYAQEKKGQRLHLVKEVDDLRGGTVPSLTALCGRSAPRGWRMTCNMPLNRACKTCLRVRKCLLGTVYTLLEETA